MANVPITVGNRAPQITIEYPEDGQFASFTDKIRYKITVTDPEDGTTGAGISCSDVKVTVSLGHDEHAHGLSNHDRLRGHVQAGPDLRPRRRRPTRSPCSASPTPTRAARAASSR